MKIEPQNAGYVDDDIINAMEIVVSEQIQDNNAEEVYKDILTKIKATSITSITTAINTVNITSRSQEGGQAEHNRGETYSIGSFVYSDIIQRTNFVLPAIHYDGTTQDFVVKNKAKELVDMVKPIYAREIALFRLMTEGYLMPVGTVEAKILSVDIHFSSDSRVENIPIHITLDMMPFEKYIVVKSS